MTDDPRTEGPTSEGPTTKAPNTAGPTTEGFTTDGSKSLRKHILVSTVIAFLLGALSVVSGLIPLVLFAYPGYPIGLVVAGLLWRYKGNKKDGRTLIFSGCMLMLLVPLIGVGVCAYILS